MQITLIPYQEKRYYPALVCLFSRTFPVSCREGESVLCQESSGGFKRSSARHFGGKSKALPCSLSPAVEVSDSTGS